MSSNGALWPFGNIYVMSTIPEDHAPDSKYKDLKPYQTDPLEVLNTITGLTPKILLAMVLLSSFVAPLYSNAAADFSLSWMLPIIVRDLVGSFSICFAWEYLLYSSPLKTKLAKYKMKTKLDEDKASSTHGKLIADNPSLNQIRHDQFYTFFCVLCASTVEIVTLHLYAIGFFAGATQDFFGANAFSNISWVAFTTYWRLTHFWLVHRMMHPWKTKVIPDVGKFLYKHVHSLHHKSFNPSTWAGLSMHPVEGTIYFTAAMIPACFGAHPFLFILCKLCLAIDSWVAHDGFGPPSAGVYFHYLHHAHFEINFGDTVMPLDYLFGSFCNGPPSKKPKHK